MGKKGEKREGGKKKVIDNEVVSLPAAFFITSFPE